MKTLLNVTCLKDFRKLKQFQFPLLVLKVWSFRVLHPKSRIFPSDGPSSFDY